MHVRRVTRDVYANRSTHAMGFPRHAPVGLAICDKTIVVVAVAEIFTAAIAWDV